MDKKKIIIIVVFIVIIALIYFSRKKKVETKVETKVQEQEDKDVYNEVLSQWLTHINNYCGGRKDCLVFADTVIANADRQRIIDEYNQGKNDYIMYLNNLITSNF